MFLFVGDGARGEQESLKSLETLHVAKARNSEICHSPLFLFKWMDAKSGLLLKIIEELTWILFFIKPNTQYLKTADVLHKPSVLIFPIKILTFAPSSELSFTFPLVMNHNQTVWVCTHLYSIP